MTHAHSSAPITADMIWPRLRSEAEQLRKKDAILSAMLISNILAHDSLSASLTDILSHKLASTDLPQDILRDIFRLSHQAAPEIVPAAAHDLTSILSHDPAARDVLTPFLFFKGFHALQSWRVSHWLWRQDRRHQALYLQNRISDLFGVDIHPAATIGKGIMLDHATGIVIGETALVEDDVLFWHGVTLGGTSQASGDRHPKIRAGAWLGAGSTVLGPVNIGKNARVAAGSVVLSDVPADTTVAGVPARTVKS